MSNNNHNKLKPKISNVEPKLIPRYTIYIILCKHTQLINNNYINLIGTY